MCFSANASFAVGAALLAATTYSLKKIQVKNQAMIASIPLVFAVQQITEGFVWLSLTHNQYWHWNTFSMYLFLFFAQVVWPSWVPVSMLLVEKNKWRKNIIAAITVMGIMVSLYLFYCLITYPVSSSVRYSHIHYELAFPASLVSYSGIFYFIPTVIPCFVSSVKKMIPVALLNLASFVVSKIYFAHNVISVWCFFAAAISIAILFVMNSFSTKTTS